MSQKPKRETRIITVYDDGTIHVQELHEATSTALTLDDPPPPPPPPDDTLDDGGETPTKPPGNP